MTGQQLIDLIKARGLENEEIDIEMGSCENGELYFLEIKDIITYDNYYYRTVIVPNRPVDPFD